MQTRLGRDLPLIRASADQLKQVLLNLLINAQQAMPQGGAVGVATGCGPARGAGGAASGPADTVRVVVQDSGAGIAEEDLPHIFEPFFSTKQQKGTGLGLWVSSGIVQRHGGRLLVRSRPGRGTTFTIILPVGGPPPGQPDQGARESGADARG